MEPHIVTVADARSQRNELSLDRSGFALLDWSPDPLNFDDDGEVRALFYSQAEKLVADLVGADLVIAFAHVVRSDKPGAADGRLPSFGAHIDFQEVTVRQFIVDILGREEAERRRTQRTMVINLWRPLKTVERSPLALCDASTVDRADLEPSEVRGALMDANRPPIYGFSLLYSPAHRWFYTPQMQSDEIYAFRLFDSDEGALQWTGHCAIEDPGSAPDARPRESVELRTIAFIA